MTLKKYKFYNNITAWVIFFTALITYFLTVEPTVSLWDCGEFTASSYKLEVGHPPGAPLFMLLGRFFSLFAPTINEVALMNNYVSVLSSAFTILFLFWTVTYFAKKLIVKNDKISVSSTIAIMASGFAGALAYTFSDTFWFSAVEAEVYANSSLFTAVVFWSILKWESISDEKYSNRWLIFIAYMMGLSIGVHLLNLLAIPAIVFVYYFKKYKVTDKGIFYASLLSVVLVAFLMYGIIQGYVLLASKFELMFVNGFGLGYNSGLFAFIIITVGGLIYGIYYSLKKKKVILNTIFTGVTVILIGYSTFSIIMIRSNANPPMDENNPENVFSLLSYLNREQYGSRPLLYGQHYDTDFERTSNGEVKSKPRYTYIPFEGKYMKTEKTNPEYIYDSDGKTIFPRMYNRDKLHISAYQLWGNVTPGEKPTFGNNVRFFFSYQLGHMYFRYFMWNFSGRQNNLQSHGQILKGRFITGINFIDKLMIGDQTDLPQRMKNDKSRNVYYMLPLLLGLIGLFFIYKKDKRSFIIIFLLFFFTGIAIVFYLNQTPYQPRERDYAYAGSFYSFTIWIGLGIAAIYNFLKTKINLKIVLLLTSLSAIPVPLIMAVQNWDDHDRSGRYTARDMAKNYLDSCEENAILFTYGDNDTFPLWYVQEVEGYRTDIKVVNLSLLGTDWYINQMRTQTYDASPVPFKMDHKLYREGVRDAVYVMDNPEVYINEKYLSNEIKYKGNFNDIKNQLLQILKNSQYPNLNSEEFNVIQEKIVSFKPLEFAAIISKLSDTDFINKYNIKQQDVDEIFSLTQIFLKKISEEHLPLTNAMDFVASDKRSTKLSAGTDDEINYIPSKKLSLNVPWPKVAMSSTFTAEEMSKFEKNIKWTLSSTYIFKNGLAVLEIIARNNWERPIYFATSVPYNNYYGLKKYFRLEGFAYRLVPYKNENSYGYVNTDILYDNLMNKFHRGRMNEDDVYIDNFNLRNFRVMDIRQTFALLAHELIKEEKNEKAVKVLDKCIELMPDNKIPYDFKMFEIVNLYYQTGEFEKANRIVEILTEAYKEELKYYNGFSDRFKAKVISNKSEVLNYINEFIKLTDNYKQDKQKSNLLILLSIYG